MTNQMFTYASDYKKLQDLYNIKKKKLYGAERKSFKLEEENKRLKEEIKKVKLKKNRHTIVHRAPSPSMEIKKLKEQIHGIDMDGLKIEGLLDQLVRVGKEVDKLKEEITCKESDSHNEVSQSEFDDAIEDKDEEIKELQKENNKLEEQVDELQVKQKNYDHDSCCACDVCEENDKLKEEIRCKESAVDSDEEVRAFCPDCDWEGKCIVSKARAKELKEKEENEVIGENDFCGCNHNGRFVSQEDENKCEWCEKEFCLSTLMNPTDCAEDSHDMKIRAAYDKYFGSKEDDGDICPECMIEHCSSWQN